MRIIAIIQWTKPEQRTSRLILKTRRDSRNARIQTVTFSICFDNQTNKIYITRRAEHARRCDVSAPKTTPTLFFLLTWVAFLFYLFALCFTIVMTAGVNRNGGAGVPLRFWGPAHPFVPELKIRKKETKQETCAQDKTAAFRAKSGPSSDTCTYFAFVCVCMRLRVCACVCMCVYRFVHLCLPHLCVPYALVSLRAARLRNL